jgi:threonyl-tRNA synthetase
VAAADGKQAGVRVTADLGSERMNAKIRNAQLMKVPYMLVVGDQEMGISGVRLPRCASEGAHSAPEP